MRCSLAFACARRASSSFSFSSPSRFRRSASATALFRSPEARMASAAVPAASRSRPRASAKRPAAAARSARSTLPSAWIRRASNSPGSGASPRAAGPNSESALSWAVRYPSSASRARLTSPSAACLSSGSASRAATSSRSASLRPRARRVRSSTAARVRLGSNSSRREARSDAFRARGNLGLFGRPDLLPRRPELAVQGLVGGPLIVNRPRGLVEVLQGAFEEVAPAGQHAAGLDGVGVEPGGGLVELRGEAGGLGVGDPGLHPLLRPPVEQRPLGLQVPGDEPLPLVELVEARGEVCELPLGGLALLLGAPPAAAPVPEPQERPDRPHQQEQRPAAREETSPGVRAFLSGHGLARYLFGSGHEAGREVLVLEVREHGFVRGLGEVVGLAPAVVRCYENDPSILRHASLAGFLDKQLLLRLLIPDARLRRKDCVERLAVLLPGRVESLLDVLLLSIAELIRLVDDRVRALGRRERGEEKGEGRRRRERGHERRRSCRCGDHLRQAIPGRACGEAAGGRARTRGQRGKAVLAAARSHRECPTLL